MNTPAKTFGSPSGEPNNHQAYASTNVRKTLDTTASSELSGFTVTLNSLSVQESPSPTRMFKG